MERVQVCPYCYKEVDPEDQYCRHCGKPTVKRAPKKEVPEPEQGTPVKAELPQGTQAKADQPLETQAKAEQPQGTPLTEPQAETTQQKSEETRISPLAETPKETMDSVPTEMETPHASAPFALNRQTLIALLWFGGFIAYILMMKYGWTDKMALYEEEIEEAFAERDYHDAYYKAIKNLEFFFLKANLFHFLIIVFCFALLHKIAANRATRIFLSVNIVFVVLNIVAAYLNYDNVLNAYKPDEQFNENLDIILQAFYAINALAIIYLCSMFVNNNELSRKERNWVGLFAMLNLLPMASGLANLLSKGLPQKYIEIANEHGFIQLPDLNNHFFLWSGYYSLFFIFIIALTACAGWHIIRSRAFSGEYDFGANATYKPLFKWLLGGIVAAAIVGAALYLLYVEILPKNVEFFFPELKP